MQVMVTGEHTTTVLLEQVMQALDTVRRIEIDHLERLMQRAHEADMYQVDEPPEPFPVTRQALRMLWHFRCNLQSVEETPTHG